MIRTASARILVGAALILSSVYGHAKTWVEFGAEYEQYSDQTHVGAPYNYEQLNGMTPYARFFHSPDSNEWNVWGRVFKKHYPNENLYTDKQTTGMTNRAELYFTRNIRRGSWRFRPGVGIRYNGYDIDRSEIEYRFYPQMDYFINPDNQLFINGHVYVGDSKGKRFNDTAAQQYTDWGYEAEFGLLHRFNSTSSIRPHFFTEYDDFDNNFRINYWQFRLVYSHKIGRATINPFFRYGLGRRLTEQPNAPIPNHPDRDGATRDINYSRVGVYGNVGLSGKWNFIYETYYEFADFKGYQRDAVDMTIDYPDRNKFFIKFGIQRYF